MARVWRDGQTKPCFIYRMIAVCEFIPTPPIFHIFITFTMIHTMILTRMNGFYINLDCHFRREPLKRKSSNVKLTRKRCQTQSLITMKTACDISRKTTYVTCSALMSIVYRTLMRCKLPGSINSPISTRENI